MNISPTEAEEALAAIQTMMQKTRRALSSSGAYAFLIIWGVVWLIGFLGNQFLPTKVVGYLWMGLDCLGGVLSWVVGARMNRNVRSTANVTSGKRIAWFWILLIVYLVAIIGVAWPADVKQIAMFIVLIIMIGWLAMGLLLDFTSIKLTFAITALALVGYFLLPDYFHLLMAFLGGGGLIAFGLYIRSRW
jgi:hypothetical protein